MENEHNTKKQPLNELIELRQQSIKLEETLNFINTQFEEFKKTAADMEKESESLSMELSISLFEVFEALKKISSGDPDVIISEESGIEIISKLKHMVNITAKNIGEMVDQSHEFAMVLAEHFDVLHRVSTGELSARVSGESKVELLEALKKVTNEMIESIDREITKRKQMEEKLIESEERYRRLFETSKDGLLLMDKQTGNVINVNPAIEELLGFSSKEIIGKKLKDIGLLKNIEDIQEVIQKLNLVGFIHYYDVSVENKIGQKIDTEIYLTDRAKVIQCNIRDITEHKRAEEALKESEKKYRNLVDNALVGIYKTNLKGDFLFANDALAKIFEFHSPEEMMTKSVPSVYKNPEERNVLINNLKKKGKVDSFEIEILTSAGTTKDILLNATLDDEVISGMLIDITERKKAEKMLRISADEIEDLYNNAPCGYHSLDKDGVFIRINDTELSWLGYSREEVIGKKNFADVITPKSLQVFKDNFPKFKERGWVNDVDIDLISKNGSIINILISATAIKDASGNYQMSRTTLYNITERKKSEESLRKSEARLANAQRIAHLGSWDWNILKNKLYWSDEIYRIFGLTPQAFGATYDAFLESVHPDDRELVKNSVKQALDEKKSYSIEHRIVLPDGSIRFVHEQGEATYDEDGNPVRMTGTVQDITERKQMEERLQYLAYYDALTDLPNRNLFLDRVNQAIARAEPTSRIVAVLITNIDRFKSINDTYGSEIGDRVLKEIAGRLSTSVRKGDTIARLSNDEFGIALLDVAHPDDIVMVLEKIIKDISYPLKVDGDELALTFSTGVSLYPNDGNSASELLKAAGLALGTAKKERMKPYQFFTEDLNIKASELILMEKGLLKAITNEEFILHYQPYWDITTKKMVGMEALIRWQSKDKGLVPPGKFISVLEDTGMIIEVGEWILREAMRQVKEWQNNGYPVVPVSVNMSLVQFRQKDLAEMVKKIMEECGYYPSLLTLEITESAFMQDIEFTKSVLTAMKEIGCSVSIDDFGTGYSSLAYLKRFPVDNLKIDISFIREMVKDPDSASIVMAIINMAHTLNLKTIAEGIETEEQWNFLRLLRCDMGQGFLS